MLLLLLLLRLGRKRTRRRRRKKKEKNGKKKAGRCVCWSESGCSTCLRSGPTKPLATPWPRGRWWGGSPLRPHATWACRWASPWRKGPPTRLLGCSGWACLLPKRRTTSHSSRAPVTFTCVWPPWPTVTTTTTRTTRMVVTTVVTTATRTQKACTTHQPKHNQTRKRNSKHSTEKQKRQRRHRKCPSRPEAGGEGRRRSVVACVVVVGALECGARIGVRRFRTRA
mmetsp:Transcript_31099/g.52494  ORF Transcript_31099/g.52494 Transcript_31099/m.52494 type:complete len:225 (-) Transcript_31099:457-1131(-)